MRIFFNGCSGMLKKRKLIAAQFPLLSLYLPVVAFKEARTLLI
jgi:hypothetical protein